MRIANALTASFLLFIPPAISLANHAPVLGFEASEHVAAGDTVSLRFRAGEPAVNGYVFTLPNGLKLTYGQLVSMGDFYEIPGEPLTTSPSDEVKKARFLKSFGSLAQNTTALDEAPKIIAVIQSERDAVDQGIKEGKKAEEVFAAIDNDNNRQWNCITGGDCSSSWWLREGRYLALVKQDVDHFGLNAWSTYEIGHLLAIQTAIEAHTTQDQHKLEYAYAINAFASHFLSDRFASGHMRTPRVELPATVTPSLVGALLTHFMHIEENKYGLHVHNLRGDHWVAFGDGNYFDASNAQSNQLMQETLQASADDIFTAYLTGAAPAADSAYALIPFPDEIKTAANQDISPLFYWDDETQQMMRRTDVANVHDNHWTSNWWGWTTLALLATQTPLPPSSQAELIQAGFASESVQYGVITDKKFISKVQHAMQSKNHTGT